jgi:hypothetical protein
MFADVNHGRDDLKRRTRQLPAQGYAGAQRKKGFGEKRGKARKYSMLLAEVPITLATGSDEAAPTFMRCYFEITETAEIAKAYAAC